MNQPTNQAYQIKEKLAELEESMLAKTPDMPILLQKIHRQLDADPDVVTLLSNEDCSILVRGLTQQTGASIAATVIKKGTKKAMSRMTVADL